MVHFGLAAAIILGSPRLANQQRHAAVLIVVADTVLCAEVPEVVLAWTHVRCIPQASLLSLHVVEVAPGDVQEVMGTAGMGHNNPRQKIQYHLKLKQELEEMRHECMLLLRERFHLEQCVRSAFEHLLAIGNLLCIPALEMTFD